ncbi:glycosyltransferase [uncultured Bacteroides sp.]|uniref:glycosyltransferase family 8 protein n=1 Tax=uncultured Bacteroides sp. TaxID=162156 RepID=UPI0025E6FE66|nr:glycosyltransferase [uncultured Bacteroides sp.]
METIPLFFTFDHNYVLAACVALHSLLSKASQEYQYKLYIVHTDLQSGHIRRITKTVTHFRNASVLFKDASHYNTAWDKLRNKSHFSKEIFYKLTAAEMFPEYDRILFSDVDVIFTADISSSFFLYPDEKFYYAGTRPIQENTNLPRYKKEFTPQEVQLIADYEISAGYMLINLKKIREDNKQAELTESFHRNLNRLILPEQDCIALCCAPYLRFMPYKYVVCNFQFHQDDRTLKFNPNNKELQDRQAAVNAYHEMLEQAVQLHYPGQNKPWNSPFVFKYKEWLSCCCQSGQLGYYLRMQPAYLIQRLKRYSLSRFLKKLKNKYHG